jgi:hypothetical protein
MSSIQKLAIERAGYNVSIKTKGVPLPFGEKHT